MTIDYIKENKLIIFEAISGSRAYGTSLPTSDTDIRGVFIQPLKSILRDGYIDQIADNKNDIIFYELKRFLELLSNNNPNIMELINMPDDCVIYKDPIYDKILDVKKKFISKRCKVTFGGYAIQQISKATGLNKKMNYDKEEMKQKSVLDFCYAIHDNKSILVEKFIKDNYVELTIDDIGLSKLDHARDLHVMYNLKYVNQRKGIISSRENVNDIQVISIPKDSEIIGYMIFNKDAYSVHCKKVKEYNTWVSKRNADRYKINKDHGKNYDSKNMMHTFRLLHTAIGIADNIFNVRCSPQLIEQLMQIRKGYFEFDDLIKEAKELQKVMDESFEKSSLPDTVDIEFVKDLLFEIRKDYYFN